MADITLKQAQAVLKAALSKAEEIDTKMDIAVVDTGANLGSAHRHSLLTKCTGPCKVKNRWCR